MVKPPINEILSVDPEVEQLLGKTAAQIAEMTTKQFAELSYEKGIIWKVGEGGRVRGLTIAITRDQAENVIG